MPTHFAPATAAAPVALHNAPMASLWLGAYDQGMAYAALALVSTERSGVATLVAG